MKISISGFPAGARVRLQMGVYSDPPQNCCVSFVFPRLGHPAIALGADGRGTVSMRVPRQYARCVTNACPGPDLTPYRCGQRVFVAATDSDYTAYDEYVGVVGRNRR